MRYTIPLIPPSLNKYIGRNNVWEYRADKQKWKDYCVLYCHPTHTPEKARVTITYVFGTKRRHDADNYQKMLLDGLVSAGCIKDDDFEHCEVLVRGGYEYNNPHTIIEIEEI